jgi:PAS domain S-box-containing protein
MDKIKNCIQGEQSTVEYTFSDTTNKSLWFRYNFTPIINSLGQVESVSISSLDITDEKNYLLSHEKSENMISSIFNATETGICVTDAKGRFVKVNEGYARIYGYQASELIGQSFSVVVLPEQRAFAEKLHVDFIKGKEELPGEWQVVKKDGTLMDIYASAKLLINPDGSRFKVTTVRDITETKKYKNLLIDTQETAKVGGWEYDLINHELTWTEEVYKIYGLPVGEALDIDKMLDNFVDEGRQALKDCLDMAIDQGKPYDLELQFTNQKNQTLWIRTTCKPIRVYNKTVKLFGTFQDVTVHKHAEQEIKKLSLVASKTSNGVIITDKYGKVEWVNEGFEKMSGYTLEEMVTKSPGHVLQGAETDPSARENMNSQIKARRNFSEDILNYRKDGTPYWVNINFTPVFNHKNELTNYIAIETDITERKQKEQQMGFQATILENVRDSVIVTDLNGSIIYWNEGAEAIFGYTREEMLHQPMSKINPGFDSHAFIERHLSGNNLYASGREWQGTHKDGRLLWINVKTNPMYNAKGEITGIIGVSTDITTKKLAVEQLRKTEVSLKAMFDTSPNAHFLLDKEYKIVSFNKVASQYIKMIWQKEVATGDSLLDYSNPADLEDFKTNFRKCVNGQLMQFEKRIQYPNGQDIWYEILYMPVEGSQKEVEAISFSSMNITSRKFAEQQLKESNKALADFRYAITSASIVSIADRLGNITYANDNFVMISKHNREELMGQNHRILNSGHHSQAFFSELWRTIVSGKIWRGEIKNKAKDGTYYWVDTFIIPFMDEQGKPLQYLSIRNDITARKQTEETLIRQNTELEKTNAELDRFVYSASHNLRAPLTSIMGLINIINSGDKAEMYLAMMEKSVKKLDEFIKDIVNYSKNSRLEIDSEKIDFEDLIHSTAEDLKFMKDADKIEVRCHISGNHAFYSDQQRIKVIMGNLLSNAFKYHDISQPQPYVEVTVTLTPTQAKLMIKDNGAGIGEEHHQKLFSMFYRATTRSEGSGLGLYIVKEVIDKLGGTIEFDSLPGKGTTFEITLPNLKQIPIQTV